MSAGEGCVDDPRMPWDESYFPRSMVDLAPAVRTKTIGIANAPLEEGDDGDRAVRMAISHAKRWGRGDSR